MAGGPPSPRLPELLRRRAVPGRVALRPASATAPRAGDPRRRSGAAQGTTRGAPRVAYEHLSLLTYLAAFGGGLISFLSPCVLPIVPGYVSLVTGLEISELQRDSR